MKKLLIIFLFVCVTASVYGQYLQHRVGGVHKLVSYSDYMNSVKENNPTLKALNLTKEAQQEGSRVGIVPNDPEVEAMPMFNGSMEMTAKVGFAFPTVYVQMKRMAKLSREKSEQTYYLGVFTTIQNIDKTFVEAVYNNKKVALMDSIRQSNKGILQSITASFNRGNATILDLNTVKSQVIRSQSDLSDAEVELKNVKRRLVAFNGGVEIEVSADEYPMYNIGDVENYVERAYSRSYDIKLSESDSLIAAQNIRLNRHAWTPNLTVGYRLVLEGGNPSNAVNGIVAGLSIPLWQNLHKTKTAKLEYDAAVFNSRQAKIDAQISLEALKNSLVSIKRNIDMYNSYLKDSSSRTLLKKAVVAGEISVVDYYVELNTVLGIELTLLDYEYKYHTLLAEMQSLLY